MSKLIYDMKMELITMTNHFLKAKLLFNKKKELLEFHNLLQSIQNKILSAIDRLAFISTRLYLFKKTNDLHSSLINFFNIQYANIASVSRVRN